MTEREQDYRDLMRMDGSPAYLAAVNKLVPEAKSLGDVYRVATALYRQLCDSDRSFEARDKADAERELRRIPSHN